MFSRLQDRRLGAKVNRAPKKDICSMTKLVSSGIALLTALLPLSAFAAGTTFTDNAANGYAANYAGVSKTGFGAFTVAAINGAGNTAPFSGTFIGSAAASEANTGTPTPASIDSTGNSFGFYANGGATASVTIARSFTQGLQNVGDTFSLNFVPGYNDAGTSGVSLSTTANPDLGDFQYRAGTGFLFNNVSTGQTFTSGAFQLTYTVTSATTYSFTTGVAGTNSPFAFTATGTFAGPINGFRVFATNSGSGASDHNGYFNNLSQTVNSAAAPEPGDMGLLIAGIGVLGGIQIVRRRRA